MAVYQRQHHHRPQHQQQHPERMRKVVTVEWDLAVNRTLLDGSNVRLNWNIESDMNVHWIKFKNFLSLY